ncbi:MAG: proline dehydrogenase family protein [Bacteroidales bacterium]|nr:proline dehydrogenase family protein [Bacteroidales bacterium]MBN2748982.1 proline dehydrogenase family protein [Bacteroidales bacterium]
MINFENTEIAFAYRFNGELSKAKFLFNTVASPLVVRLGSGLLKLAAFLHIPISWAVKPTIFKHFVGGESLKECQPVVATLARYNVRSILDYSVEGKSSPKEMERAFNEILSSVAFAASNPNVVFSVFKPTGLIDVNVLTLVSEGKLLSELQQEQYNLFLSRVDTLCSAAAESGKPILIDAEDSWYQKALDEVIESMMAKYNTQRAVVFNTLQMYRTDRFSYLKAAHKRAQEKGYILGMKYVRGAYMEKERVRAVQMGYISPICETKAATDKNFNEAIKYSVSNIDTITTFCGTHNQDSVNYLVCLMDSNGIAPSDSRIYFSQLYGMSDNLSFNLAAAGYNVAKYVPYGPVKHVMPYLIRRAEENTSVKGQTGRELALIKTEIRRRRTAR